MIYKIGGKNTFWFKVIIVLAIAFFWGGAIVLWLLPEKKPPLKSSSSTINQNNSNINANVIKEHELKQLMRVISVRIFAEGKDNNRGGTGVLIGHNQNNYLIITNDHVVSNREFNYQIQTYEGRIYSSKILTPANKTLEDDDLALIEFTSEYKYQSIPIKNNIKLEEGEKVWACGFPFQDNLTQSKNLEITIGNLQKILNAPLIGGYQFGYTNNVRNGMSGGAIINQKGELIGLNGMPKNPLFGNPYVFKNGQSVSDKEWNKMSNLSWGIPSKYLHELIQNYQKKRGG